MDTLLRRHHARIYAVCRRVAGNDADAADATQEAMLLIVRRIATFDGRSKFTTWAHRVATNACLDELRRRRRRPVVGLADDDADDDRVTVDRARPVDDDVSDRLTIDDALADLPDTFRLPLVLRDLGGHDYADIAAILDIPPGTVRSRIARARARMAELLGEDAESDTPVGNQTTTDRRPTA